MKRVCILGATGSIGHNCLEIIRLYPDRFQVCGISARTQFQLLTKIAKEFQVRHLALEAAPNQASLPQETKIHQGPQALEELIDACQPDILVCGISGWQGMGSFFYALGKVKRILLANKEVLVVAGRLFVEKMQASKKEVIPIDSEHCALFQCLGIDNFSSYPLLTNQQRAAIESLIITGSGGPFHNFSQEQLQGITPEQACKHPNWSMGTKISIDSASFMNKALELIEAHWLFGVEVEKLGVWIQQTSLMHAAVSYIDGNHISHLSKPSMQIPIATALAHPERLALPEQTSLASVEPEVCLVLAKPDSRQQACLDLAKQAIQAEQNAAALLNIANEMAVKAFVERSIRFVDIVPAVRGFLDSQELTNWQSLEEIVAGCKRAEIDAEKYILETF